MAGLDGFIDEQDKEDKVEKRRFEGIKPDEFKSKMEELREQLEAEWGTVERIDVDELKTDPEGVPYIILRVDEDFATWVNDLEAITNVPPEQIIYDAIAMYHSLLGFAIYKATGDPLYQRRKQRITGDSKMVMEFVRKEVQAVEMRVNLIKDLEKEVESQLDEYHNMKEAKENAEPMGSEEKSKTEEVVREPTHQPVKPSTKTGWT